MIEGNLMTKQVVIEEVMVLTRVTIREAEEVTMIDTAIEAMTVGGLDGVMAGMMENEGEVVTIVNGTGIHAVSTIVIAIATTTENAEGTGATTMMITRDNDGESRDIEHTAMLDLQQK